MRGFWENTIPVFWRRGSGLKQGDGKGALLEWFGLLHEDRHFQNCQWDCLWEEW